MSINSILESLNPSQRLAATANGRHTLVLAGAGTGKTRTIIARAAYLVSEVTAPERILVLAFTRRAANEIVERVKCHLGESANALRASTFHTWCMSLLRRAPETFGTGGFSVIDREDQEQLFKALRSAKKGIRLPTASQLAALYSYARNTGKTLDETLRNEAPELYNSKGQIAELMLAYEARKKERKYLDYDDILSIVAAAFKSSEEVLEWVSSMWDHILVDEMQDTNPLQWSLLEPLSRKASLYCVGDDAQSIYGFRGADFRNVHSFKERLPEAEILRLEDNYRSTQEILDVSNWLLDASSVQYDKKLRAVKGSAGVLPKMHSFDNEHTESRWVVEDIEFKRAAGKNWKDHMILVRSTSAARSCEAALLAKEIPYRFIGGTKLMESAHIRDLLSALRIVGNPSDEIAWMRYLQLWPGVGEAKAGSALEAVLAEPNLNSALIALEKIQKMPSTCLNTLRDIARSEGNVQTALLIAAKSMEEILAKKFREQEWDRRKRDIALVANLAEKHSSLLGFIEEYVLDPVYDKELEEPEQDKAIVITIHSAKGTESDICYVVGASAGMYPSAWTNGDPEKVEEERRVLYVALTRAREELIVTRNLFGGVSKWRYKNSQDSGESYFFANLPSNLVEETIHAPESITGGGGAPKNVDTSSFMSGISIE